MSIKNPRGMRAAAFIRYHGGQGFGHVGWAFDFDGTVVNAGSVENHSGRFFSTAQEMGFWNRFLPDPTQEMRSRAYDDVKLIDVPNPDPVLAYRTVLWIKSTGYRALVRNCEDDAYDVLRAYGVADLTPPSWSWFPKSWFKRFRGNLAHVSDFKWNADGSADKNSAPIGALLNVEGLSPWQPTWRRAWHPDAPAFILGRIFHKPSN